MRCHHSPGSDFATVVCNSGTSPTCCRSLALRAAERQLLWSNPNGATLQRTLTRSLNRHPYSDTLTRPAYPRSIPLAHKVSVLNSLNSSANRFSAFTRVGHPTIPAKMSATAAARHHWACAGVRSPGRPGYAFRPLVPLTKPAMGAYRFHECE